MQVSTGIVKAEADLTEEEKSSKDWVKLPRGLPDDKIKELQGMNRKQRRKALKSIAKKQKQQDAFMRRRLEEIREERDRQSHEKYCLIQRNDGEASAVERKTMICSKAYELAETILSNLPLEALDIPVVLTVTYSPVEEKQTEKAG